jgi:hypothetical protein
MSASSVIFKNFQKVNNRPKFAQSGHPATRGPTVALTKKLSFAEVSFLQFEKLVT